jgi:hypothetical protein
MEEIQFVASTNHEEFVSDVAERISFFLQKGIKPEIHYSTTRETSHTIQYSSLIIAIKE